MSDPAEMPTSRHQPAPEVIEIAKAIARGLARQDHEELCEQRRREVGIFSESDIVGRGYDEKR